MMLESEDKSGVNGAFTIHLLGDEEALLEDVLSDVEAETREQLSSAAVQFDWHAPDTLPSVMLSSLQHINIKRITREVIANSLKHAHPEKIWIDISLDKDNIHLRIGNDGEISEPSTWIAGRGQNNIKFRVAELNGSCKWMIEQKSGSQKFCIFIMCIPISNQKQVDRH